MEPFGSGGPVVVGHRGAPWTAPENTPEAFAAAAEQGATWVELDVRRSRDGLVVTHEARTAEGAAVVATSTQALRHAGVHCLEEVLEALPEGLGANVEVKNLPFEPDHDRRSELVAVLAPLLRAQLERRPLFASSFNPRTVGALVEALPGVPAGFVAARQVRAAVALRVALRIGARVLCPHARAAGVDGPLVSAAHAAGLAVMVWTVDEATRARALAALGVDALCTNDPETLVTALRDHR